MPLKVIQLHTRNIAIIAPVMLIIAMLVFITIFTYLKPNGHWYVVIYPKGTDAFMASYNYADAVIYSHNNKAIVYVEDDKQLSLLKDNNVTIMDPLGVPLCLNNDSTLKMLQ